MSYWPNRSLGRIIYIFLSVKMTKNKEKKSPKARFSGILCLYYRHAK
jgi:hypothetical protein